MVISDKNRYLFVELPLTGSTAVSDELCANYDGTRILQKHATYRDFLRVATNQQKRYFVFSGLRNPLDQTVSRYFKFVTDYQRQFSDDHRLDRRWLDRIAYEFSHMRRYRFIQSTGAEFATFFLRFYRIPYDDWSGLDHKSFDSIIRFESLSDDFAKVLQRIGLEQIRPLPVKNKTPGRRRDYLAYYEHPEVIKRAKWVFGPYMRRWGYDFPAEWGVNAGSWQQEVAFRSAELSRKIYWKHLRRPWRF